jgi:hypothetical protein
MTEMPSVAKIKVKVFIVRRAARKPAVLWERHFLLFSHRKLLGQKVEIQGKSKPASPFWMVVLSPNPYAKNALCNPILHSFEKLHSAHKYAKGSSLYVPIVDFLLPVTSTLMEAPL